MNTKQPPPVSPALIDVTKFGMRYNAYHLSKNDISTETMRYGGGHMDPKAGDKDARARIVEVQRVSPYEFCLTAEPVVLSGVDVATTVVYGSSSDRAPQPFFAQSLTFER